MLDSVIRANKKYYPHTLLEERKHGIKKNKMESLINDDLDPRLSDESDNEYYNESVIDLMMSLTMMDLMIKFKSD